ncbi:hypothetical protein KUTeg_000034 [Tegillarca granosa]|uniref:F5/8 type C domain-containing protein n=1 Tax=Tegillarca granosa TaxID=220873 RepID=A0ABQ9G354_TEGGR|nr:hypothetical protein KUTeg_000034 [Tegillarca granosa]
MKTQYFEYENHERPNTYAKNLALNQNVTQSSYHGGYPPENAVDGNVEQILDKCSHTGWNPTPSWLKVDLSWIYEIKSIKIYHRNATIF